MNILDNYEQAKNAIYEHVGFVEDWVVCPLDFQTHMFWSIDEDEVKYAETEEELETGEGNHYSDEIYKQHFYRKHVFRGEKYTMIFCNPCVDGMKWWRIFENSKER